MPIPNKGPKDSRPQPPDTPELRKLNAHQHTLQDLRAFLEFLTENGLTVCDNIDGEYSPVMYPGGQEMLFWDHLEIDAKKVEEERCALLEYQRALNEYKED